LAIVYGTFRREATAQLPMLSSDLAQIITRRNGTAISKARFLAHVNAVAALLPRAPAAVNLCEDRYAFMVAFCAIMLRGQINLLPSSRAPQAIDEVMAAHPGCYALGEQALTPAPPDYRQLPLLVSPPSTGSAEVPRIPQIPASQVVAIGYTSGSTGSPTGHAKTWENLHVSTAGNLAMLAATLGEQFTAVATVPAQHMYGIEMSVLLPLLGRIEVHSGRPLLPGDIAAALTDVSAPRVLVTTPVHLRALVESGIRLPPLAAMVSATAPLSVELARLAEQRFGAPLLEVFGSTETCVFASRRPGFDERWALYQDVQLHPHPDGTEVTAPQLDMPVQLADIVSLSDAGRRFVLRGRQADMLEIAGKRASLGDLTRRLLAIPGVSDAVVFQLDDGDAIGVRRIAALAVAPGLNEQMILEALRRAVDPLFLPRPLRLVDALPRNDAGKLPRDALLTLLAHHH
jgi:acyl-coenzyme A synthetase/AMP-(fatty) acid ligase